MSKIDNQTKLRCNGTETLYYVNHIYISSNNTPVIVVGAYGEKYMSRPLHHTIDFIRSNFEIEE